MKRSYQKIIKLMEELIEEINDTPNVELFAAPEGLYLISHDTRRVLAFFESARVDGGDPDRTHGDDYEVTHLNAVGIR